MTTKGLQSILLQTARLTLQGFAAASGRCAILAHRSCRHKWPPELGQQFCSQWPMPLHLSDHAAAKLGRRMSRSSYEDKQSKQERRASIRHHSGLSTLTCMVPTPHCLSPLCRKDFPKPVLPRKLTCRRGVTASG